jgi:hypothetical protein
LSSTGHRTTIPPMNVYQIVIAPAVYAELKLTNLTYSTQKEAADVVRKAYKEKGWKLEPETTEDNCIVFRNEDGVEIARVKPVPEPKWRKQ